MLMMKKGNLNNPGSNAPNNKSKSTYIFSFLIFSFLQNKPLPLYFFLTNTTNVSSSSNPFFYKKPSSLINKKEEEITEAIQPNPG